MVGNNYGQIAVGGHIHTVKAVDSGGNTAVAALPFFSLVAFWALYALCSLRSYCALWPYRTLRPLRPPFTLFTCLARSACISFRPLGANGTCLSLRALGATFSLGAVKKSGIPFFY